MTDTKQNKEVMSAQELENVSGGKIFPRRVNFPEKLPIVSIGKRNDEGIVWKRPFISKFGF